MPCKMKITSIEDAKKMGSDESEQVEKAGEFYINSDETLPEEDKPERKPSR